MFVRACSVVLCSVCGYERWKRSGGASHARGQQEREGKHLQRMLRATKKYPILFGFSTMVDTQILTVL